MASRPATPIHLTRENCSTVGPNSRQNVVTRPQRRINSGNARMARKSPTRSLAKSFGARVVLVLIGPPIRSKSVPSTTLPEGNAMVTRHRIDRRLSIQEIKANPRNARTHSQAQIRQIAESIKAFGFGAPVLVDETLTLIGGY